MKIIIAAIFALTSVSAFAESYSRVSASAGQSVTLRIQDDVAQKMFEALTEAREVTANSIQGDVMTSRHTSSVDCAKIDHPATGLVSEYVCLLSMMQNGEFKNPLITTASH